MALAATHQAVLATATPDGSPPDTDRPPAFAPSHGPRVRVMVVNDLSGDCDGLFATVHALLSPSTQAVGIVGTAAAQPDETAIRSTELAAEMLRLMRLSGKVPIHVGATAKLVARNTPADCLGARAIVAEAMRDSPLPLFVTVGGGLTEVASALLMEPRIAGRFTLVWIGGNPHGDGGPEYNFNLDPTAAQHVFNETSVPIWQVTSKGYGTCHVSNTELQDHVASCGDIGAWLYAKVVEGYPPFVRAGMNMGETWGLGDNPLVLLTALTGWIPDGRSKPFRYEKTSSRFSDVFVPHLRGDGSYLKRTEGRRMRVYDDIDTRLMLGDFFSKMRMNYGRVNGGGR